MAASSPTRIPYWPDCGRGAKAVQASGCQVPSRLWKKPAAAGCGDWRPPKTLAFWGVAQVEKGHGWLFPRAASRLWKKPAAAGCGDWRPPKTLAFWGVAPVGCLLPAFEGGGHGALFLRTAGNGYSAMDTAESARPTRWPGISTASPLRMVSRSRPSQLRKTSRPTVRIPNFPACSICSFRRVTS
jgi:hypothetical protein